MVQAACDCSPHVIEWLTRASDLYARQDIDGMGPLFEEDVVFADHRPLGAHNTNNLEELGDLLRATYEMLPDFKISVLVLANDGDTYLARDTYDGHAAAGGGEAVMQWWVVDTLRDGKLAREDIYGTEDEARAEYERRIC